MGIKIIEVMVVFFLAMNLFSGMLISTGAAQDIGLGGQVEVGGDGDAEAAQQSAEEISTGSPTGSTLFGMYNVLAKTLGQLRTIVLGGPAMLSNAGVPSFITTTMEAVMLVVYGIGIVKFLRGI
jgi:hypothetical protein